MQALATCQPRISRKIQSQDPTELHTFELFFTLPLHDSYLNIEFLNAELQANWHKIKPIKWLIKFNLTMHKHKLAQLIIVSIRVITFIIELGYQAPRESHSLIIFYLSQLLLDKHKFTNSQK